jgi:hypothetical protein
VGAGSTSLQLFIERDSDPITGSVTVGADHPQPFKGWIELVAAIERARSGQREQTQTLGWLPGAKSSGV